MSSDSHHLQESQNALSDVLISEELPIFRDFSQNTAAACLSFPPAIQTITAKKNWVMRAYKVANPRAAERTCTCPGPPFRGCRRQPVGSIR